jgi:hypothetical protein
VNDVLPRVPTRDDMVDRALIFDPKSPRHVRSIANASQRRQHKQQTNSDTPHL